MAKDRTRTQGLVSELKGSALKIYHILKDNGDWMTPSEVGSKMGKEDPLAFAAFAMHGLRKLISLRLIEKSDSHSKYKIKESIKREYDDE